MKRFKKIYIEITNNCNLDCSFCKKDNRQKETMKIADFEKILKKIHDYTDYIYLHVKGEPLLHPDLANILSLCDKYHKKVVITTNGTMLKAKLDILINNHNIRQINISLHSHIGKPFEKYFDDIYFCLKEILTKTAIIISLRVWIKDEKLLKKIHARFNIDGSLITKSSLKLQDRLYLNYDEEFIWPSLNNDYYNEQGTCLGLKQQIAILVDGTVVPCCLDDEGIINLGNIYTDNFDEILNSNRSKSVINGFNNNKKSEELCRHCQFKRGIIKNI